MSTSAIYVVTVSHVVEGAKVSLRFDTGEEAVARVLDMQGGEKGLAIVSIDKAKAPLGISILSFVNQRMLRVGNTLDVLGYPDDAEHLQVTPKGYRRRLGNELELDSPLERGNSGGPVMIDGCVVGIATGNTDGYGVATIAEVVDSYVEGLVPDDARAPVTNMQGTRVAVRFAQTLTSNATDIGDTVALVVASNLLHDNGRVAVPQGSRVECLVGSVASGKPFGGAPGMIHLHPLFMTLGQDTLRMANDAITIRNDDPSKRRLCSWVCAGFLDKRDAVAWSGQLSKTELVVRDGIVNGEFEGAAGIENQIRERRGAVFRSFLLPGWGQRWSKRSAGSFYFGAVLAGVLLATYFDQEGDRLASDADHLPIDSNTPPDDPLRASYNELAGDAAHSWRLRDGSLWYVGIVWAANIVDMLIWGGNEDSFSSQN